MTVQLFRLLFFKLNFQIGNADESCERGCRLFLLIDGVAKTEDQTEQDTLKSCKHSKLSFLSLVFYYLFLSLPVYRFYSFFLSHYISLLYSPSHPLCLSLFPFFNYTISHVYVFCYPSFLINFFFFVLFANKMQINHFFSSTTHVNSCDF
jgi:hypothetical protein